MSNAATPAAVDVQAACLELMTPATQRLVKTIEERKLRKGQADVVYHYDIGVYVAKAEQAPETYGENFVDLVSKYFGEGDNGKRYYREMRRFSETYERDAIVNEAKTPMANGRPLSVEHFVNLTRVAKAADRRKFLARVRRENLSAATLLSLIQAELPSSASTGGAGGRPPSVPGSPVASVKKTANQATSFGNWLDTFVKNTVPTLEDEEPTDTLYSVLADALAKVSDAVNKGGSTLARLTALKTAMDAKRESAGDAGDDASDEPPDEADDFEELEAAKAAPKRGTRPAGRK